MCRFHHPFANIFLVRITIADCRQCKKYDIWLHSSFVGLKRLSSSNHKVMPTSATDIDFVRKHCCTPAISRAAVWLSWFLQLDCHLHCQLYISYRRLSSSLQKSALGWKQNRQVYFAVMLTVRESQWISFDIIIFLCQWKCTFPLSHW